MKKDFPFFNEMVDNLVEFSQYDPKLADSIVWLDMQARKHNVSFYDKVYEVLLKYDAQTKAKEWMKNKK